MLLVNPPSGERSETAGVAGRSQGGRERAQVDEGTDFFNQLAHFHRFRSSCSFFPSAFGMRCF